MPEAVYPLIYWPVGIALADILDGSWARRLVVLRDCETNVTGW